MYVKSATGLSPFFYKQLHARADLCSPLLGTSLEPNVLPCQLAFFLSLFVRACVSMPRKKVPLTGALVHEGVDAALAPPASLVDIQARMSMRLGTPLAPPFLEQSPFVRIFLSPCLQAFVCDACEVSPVCRPYPPANRGVCVAVSCVFCSALPIG